jgi:glucokinase
MRSSGSAQLVLAGDVGGTNARLRLYERSGKRIVDEAVLPSGAANSLAAILREYLSRRKARVVAAVLGVAGPVVGGIADVTNLPWKVIDEKKLARDLKIPKVRLINDLAAGAVGCTIVPAKSRLVISKGKPQKGANIAVIAAGTGLGEAFLVWDGERYVPSATEGGHCDFAPNSEIEVELWAHLRKLLDGGHVSVERAALSGPGLGRIYDFFVRKQGGESLEVSERLASGDRNANIASLGLSGESRAAADAVDLFCRIYGSEAGNLALKGLAVGGVYLLGRIATTLIPLKKELFLEGMRFKGRMGELMERVPVTVVIDKFVGLTGAGHLAARLAAG